MSAIHYSQMLCQLSYGEAIASCLLALETSTGLRIKYELTNDVITPPSTHPIDHVLPHPFTRADLCASASPQGQARRRPGAPPEPPHRRPRRSQGAGAPSADSEMPSPSLLPSSCRRRCRWTALGAPVCDVLDGDTRKPHMQILASRRSPSQKASSRDAILEAEFRAPARLPYWVS